MSYLYDMKKKVLLVMSAVLAAVGCSETVDYSDLRSRDELLLKSGMIYYGEDPEDASFDDMYYAFAASEDEMSAVSDSALYEFKERIKVMPDRDRRYLKHVFDDIADLADLANYSYKDEQVRIPEGWVDMGAKEPEISKIFDKPSFSKYVPMGLKCSLMANGERKVLVFAGTDFPLSWRGLDQVLHFLADAYEDVYGALNNDAAQVRLAGEIVDELLESGYVTKGNLEFAGHSLGGRLASEMSVKYGCPAVLFNAAGVSPDVYQAYEKSKSQAGEGWRGYIINVVSANDPLTCAQKYMSGSTDPVKTKISKMLSAEKNTVDQIVSLGLDIVGALVDNVMGGTKAGASLETIKDEYGETIEQLHERDYRALGAVMPIRENMGGHGIRELALALRARAELCD